MYSTLSTLNTTTEVRLRKALNHHCSGCVLTVCVCTLDGLNAEHKFRVWNLVTILGRKSRHSLLTTGQTTFAMLFVNVCFKYGLGNTESFIYDGNDGT